MVTVMIAVIVGVGVVMAVGRMYLTRDSDPSDGTQTRADGRATRLVNWEVRFTTSTRYIVSYDCEDRIERNILCWSPIRDQYECTCYRDGYEGQRFELHGVPTTPAEARTLAQRHCQWKLAE